MERLEPDTVPAGERESLEQWLEFHRATLLWKCSGLDEQQLATASCGPSELTLSGLVRHMTSVENWFHRFDGEPAMDAHPGEDAFTPASGTWTRDRDEYTRAVERSRAAVRDKSLDTVIELPHWVADDQPKVERPTSLRWVYQHMIEEYARHNGHADLIRERIDGATGD